MSVGRHPESKNKVNMTLSSKKSSGRFNASANNGKSDFPSLNAAWLEGCRQFDALEALGSSTRTNISVQPHGKLGFQMARRLDHS